MIPELTPQEIARFYSNVHIGGCGLFWSGKLNNNGYGRFEIYRGRKRIRILAHRLMVKLSTGGDPGRAVIRHGCDTPRCVTPDCLTPGTVWENVHDAIDRGRLIHRRQRASAAERLTAGEKACTRCRVMQPMEQFHPRKRALDGRVSECRSCLADRKVVARASAKLAEGR